MLSYESSVLAGIGGFVGMGTALGYGFKLMVDILGKQLSVQNDVIKALESGIKDDLKQHIADCKDCQQSIRRTKQ